MKIEELSTDERVIILNALQTYSEVLNKALCITNIEKDSINSVVKEVESLQKGK